SRLVVGIVVHVKADEIEQMLRTYFEPIQSTPSKVRDLIPEEPAQEGERRASVVYPAEPSILIGYHRPEMNHPDGPALDVVAKILSDGRTSRLYRSVVEKSRIGVSAWSSATAPGERDPNLFVLGGSPRAPHTVKELEQS